MASCFPLWSWFLGYIVCRKIHCWAVEARRAKSIQNMRFHFLFLNIGVWIKKKKQWRTDPFTKQKCVYPYTWKSCPTDAGDTLTNPAHCWYDFGPKPLMSNSCSRFTKAPFFSRYSIIFLALVLFRPAIFLWFKGEDKSGKLVETMCMVLFKSWLIEKLDWEPSL